MGQAQVEAEFKMERVVPYFQPIMNLQSNRVWRYECLARLLGDKEHIFLPSEFLTIIERENWNAELTHHIYEQSRRYCVHRNMPWSINLSEADLTNDSIVAWLIHLHANTMTTLFGIELSFSTFKNHIPIVTHLRDKCPNLTIIIDDVSDSTDTLEVALNLNIQAVKLRGTMFNDMPVDASKLARLVNLCRKHDTKLVAEHIESEETLELVTSFGIDYGQGFYLSSPSAVV